MLIIIKFFAILSFFAFFFLFVRIISTSVIAKKLKGETSVFEKIWTKYCDDIKAFNSKIFKIKLKEKIIPYFYILAVNFVGFIVLLITKTAIMWIFFIFLLYFFPRFVLNNIQKRRTTKVEKQLVSALIFLGNALKAGLDIIQGIELSLESLEPPIRDEFAQILKEYNLGVSLEDALVSMRERLKSSPIDTFVTSLIIQRETGGDVTKIIEQIVQTVRETYKLQNKVKTLTAQGKIQSIIVSSLPWCMGGLIFAIQPDFMLPMFKTTIGTTLLGFLVIWQFIGILVIKKITTIDV